MTNLITLLLLMFFNPPLYAESSLEFTEQEKQIHNQYIHQITADSALCLQGIWQEHLAFHQRWGVSKFYGDRNRDLNTRQKRIDALKRLGAPVHLVDELEPTSCIGLTLDCMGEAFAKTNDPEADLLWKKIKEHVVTNGVSGMHLINALQGLGWRILYWNPAPEKNALWDAEDPQLIKGRLVDWDSPIKDEKGRSIYHPSWGMHEARYQSVMARNKYYTARVDDKELLVGFDIDVPANFQQAPFFVGVAHAGYHVFPGFFGEVIEAHSTRTLDSIDNLETSHFNPLTKGGGPRWTRVEKYRSGIIAVPPDTVH